MRNATIGRRPTGQIPTCLEPTSLGLFGPGNKLCEKPIGRRKLKFLMIF